MENETIYKSMPKLELHAHLNGSISEKTLQKLAAEREVQIGSSSDSIQIQLEKLQSRNLQQCFTIFQWIHDVIRTPEVLRRVTVEVISDFADDNVIYLELRTTPKKVHDIPSKRVYLKSVISAIMECKSSRSSILVKLLISIDRQRGRDEGAENVDLAIEFAQKYPDVVIGMDLSGNPTTGSLEWILPLLKKAKDCGLKLTCHLPEVLNWEETDRLLEFDEIGRLGHGLFLHPSCGGTESQWALMKEKQIPIEVCITSNVISGVSESLEEHYVTVLHEEKMPFVICTDDSGVFNTTLSQEYMKFAQIVQTSLSEIKNICLDSVSYAFCSDEEKSKLKETISKFWSEQHTPTP